MVEYDGSPVARGLGRRSSARSAIRPSSSWSRASERETKVAGSPSRRPRRRQTASRRASSFGASVADPPEAVRVLVRHRRPHSTHRDGPSARGRGAGAGWARSPRLRIRRAPAACGPRTTPPAATTAVEPARTSRVHKAAARPSPARRRAGAAGSRTDRLRLRLPRAYRVARARPSSPARRASSAALPRRLSGGGWRPPRAGWLFWSSAPPPGRRHLVAEGEERLSAGPRPCRTSSRASCSAEPLLPGAERAARTRTRVCGRERRPLLAPIRERSPPQPSRGRRRRRQGRSGRRGSAVALAGRRRPPRGVRGAGESLAAVGGLGGGAAA